MRDLKSLALACQFESGRGHHFCACSLKVKLAAHNGLSVGSSPTGRTINGVGVGTREALIKPLALDECS
jgi:hypothetical protein